MGEEEEGDGSADACEAACYAEGVGVGGLVEEGGEWHRGVLDLCL